MPISSTKIGIFRRELNLFRVSTVGLPSQVIGFCLPQIYRKSTKKHGFLWFLKAAVIRCFSIFDTQKARKIGHKREQKTTKEIKTLHRFKNLKSLGVKPVPVQVRLAAPLKECRFYGILFLFSDWFGRKVSCEWAFFYRISTKFSTKIAAFFNFTFIFGLSTKDFYPPCQVDLINFFYFFIMPPW